MKTLYIIKVGTSFPGIVREYGDFDDWVRTGLALAHVPVCVVDVLHDAALPDPAQCSGVVVTGAHDMVTERLPWSVRVEQWIPSVLAAGVPFLGICYGHQLLAQAMGGEVCYHPAGIEAGTVEIDSLPECAADSLFSALPQHFDAQTVHSQTVRTLPSGAVRLASNAHEPNHAFRMGEVAWGVQFHPEYNTGIMRTYLLDCANELKQAGRNVPELLLSVRPTPVPAGLLRSFGGLVECRAR